jgi:hypothetical protein
MYGHQTQLSVGLFLHKLYTSVSKAWSAYQEMTGCWYRERMESVCHSRCAHRLFPAEVINHTIWLYFRFPLHLKTVEKILAA